MSDIEIDPQSYVYALQEEIDELRSKLINERARRIQAEQALRVVLKQTDGNTDTIEAAKQAAQQATSEAPADFRPDSGADVPLGTGVDPAMPVKT